MHGGDEGRGGAQPLDKASEVNSDQTLPVHIAKHDPLDTAKVMVGVSIAQGVIVRVPPRGLPEIISVTTFFFFLLFVGCKHAGESN